MHRRKNRQPGYLHHKPSNQAYVRINGRMVYLGIYDTAESHRRYAAAISDLNAGIPLQESPTKTDARPLTVGELAEHYLKHEQDRFGPKTKQAHAAKYAMLALVENHAGLRIDQFRPKALRRVQQNLVEKGYARREVNERVNRIRSAFRWAVSEELVMESILSALKSVPGLRPGEARDNPPREPVPPEVVEQTVIELNRTSNFGAAFLIRFLRWTGCRPGEACNITLASVDLGAEQPLVILDNHKTARFTGKPRLIPLNLHAFAVVEEAIARSSSIAPDAPLFRSTRGRCFTSNGLYQAVKRACRGLGIDCWAPYQLRHLAATEALAATGNETATAAMLGHSPSSTVIRRYSRNRLALATEAALAMEKTNQ